MKGAGRENLRKTEPPAPDPTFPGPLQNRPWLPISRKIFPAFKGIRSSRKVQISTFPPSRKAFISPKSHRFRSMFTLPTDSTVDAHVGVGVDTHTRTLSIRIYLRPKSAKVGQKGRGGGVAAARRGGRAKTGST